MKIEKEFPILKDITYLDSASGHLKPISVINVIKDFYIDGAINPHSPDSPIGIKILKQIENTRINVAQLVKAQKEEVIFNSGITEGLNMLINMLKYKLKKEDQIIISKYNHDSNILPWFKLQKEVGVKIIISDNIKKAITKKTKIISVSQKNNGLGKNVNIQNLYKLANHHNILLINDAAQAIAWETVSLKYCDAIVISGNKLYGPTGTGVLVIKKDLLKTLQPVKLGGGIIATVGKNHDYIFKQTIAAFEAGTPNTAGIIGLGAAIKFFHQSKELLTKIKKLSLYTHKELSSIPGMKLYTNPGKSIIIFDYKNYPSQDVASKLAHKYSIYVRSGIFCAHLGTKNKNGSIRVSLGIYNTKIDIDKLVDVLKNEDFFSLI